MVRFSCPKCQTRYEVADRRTAEKFHCSTCGQRLQVPAPPTNKTVLGSIEVAEDSGRVDLVPSIDAIPEALPAPPSLTIRLIGQGLQAAKFKTRYSVRKVLVAVDEMLYGLGIEWHGL